MINICLCYNTHLLFLDVAYESKVFIRHVATRGGYLHSHPHNYPGGSKRKHSDRYKKIVSNKAILEQQVTLYPHRDDNNWWTFRKVDDEETKEIEYIKHGDIVTLKHSDSVKRLHSHDIRPPMTDLEYHNEVRYKGENDINGLKVNLLKL